MREKCSCSANTITLTEIPIGKIKIIIPSNFINYELGLINMNGLTEYLTNKNFIELEYDGKYERKTSIFDLKDDFVNGKTSLDENEKSCIVLALSHYLLDHKSDKEKFINNKMKNIIRKLL